MKKRVLIASVAVALLIVSVAAAWWWRRPANVVAGALAELGSAETQKFDARLIIDNAQASQGLIGQEAEVQLLMQGAYERQEQERDSLAATIQLVTGTEGLTLRVEGETRFIGDQAYVRIEKAPPAFPLLAQLKGQWLELPRGAAPSDSAAAPDGPLFMKVERNGRDRLDGQATTLYTAEATAAAVVNMLDHVADILGTRLTADQIDGIRQGITGVDTVPVRLWVTPWSHELVKLATTLTVPGGNTIVFELKPTDRNRDVEIAVPEGALSLEGTVAGLQSGTAEAAPTPTPAEETTPPAESE
jgi:hypothetical protein